MGEFLKQPDEESVELRFRQTEEEYLAAVRLYFWRSKEAVARLIVSFALFSGGLLLLSSLLEFPFLVALILIVIIGLGLFHGYVIDLPRRYFRGDPKFRDEYHLTFTDAGIDFKTSTINAKVAWSLYTDVIENDQFYLLIYGNGIHSVSITPKRAFRDDRQEAAFRDMLRRNVDRTLKLSKGERENPEYVPKSLEPPDWR